MVFSSPVFLFLFLPIVLLLVALVRDRGAQNTVLLIASLLFYAWGEGAFVLLMLGTALFNHVCGILLDRSGSRKVVLAVAVAVDLGTLIWFKYAMFIVQAITPVFIWLGKPAPHIDPVHLPIGVSFFIFHSLSYVVDVYRRKAPAQRVPGLTALYIAFFPQLVAGPIIRYHDVADQFVSRVMNIEGFAWGARRFIVGLAKKILIADLCARIADPIFAVPSADLTPAVAWLGAVSYAVQIYFDFSGYSDMAIGLGRLFGFHFLENFNRPYVAASLREFWKRWHISLTNFFRDYLYIPLGGNKRGPARTYANLLIVFFLTGLWHGASWNFVVWGMIHGAFMLLERTGWGRVLDRSPRMLGRAYTLFVVLVAWIFFRAPDLGTSWAYLEGMFTIGHGNEALVYPAYYLTNDVALALAVGLFGGLGGYDTLIRWWRSTEPQARGSRLSGVSQDFGLLLLFVICAMAVATRTFDPFIYFRF